MKYLGIDESTLNKRDGIFTAKEISGQPILWSAIKDKFYDEKSEISSFLDEIIPKIDTIILTGAGTSAFIGLSLFGEIQRTTHVTTRSIATTDLVSHPQDYFSSESSILLISFARSGNSPESVATLRLADTYCKNCYHLVITCNQEGELAKYKVKNTRYSFILPPEANDKSLAMTGSYSGMLLSALLINDIAKNGDSNQMVLNAISTGETILNTYASELKNISDLPFTRAIFLGSGPQYGTAMESHLKLQELTDGQVICKYDSYLGFRHGPKAVVDEQTLMVYYFSNNPDVLRYEKDLVRGMNQGKKPLYQIGISRESLDDLTFDTQFKLPKLDTNDAESFLSVSNILFGQLLAFYKSMQLGLSPDSPSSSKAISRVVEGVTIY
ncbi:hypothetical protein LCGC14_0783100 [marine sediment metagenome]|uniref:SIS domain-containing protein n=2 Tax=root TaxID=1 RepID=A0A831QUE8_9FLAO|nr:SIS domain-containing protein [Pricia antarctica]